MVFTVRLPKILTHHRAFSACVILSLGVGISAAAAVIAVVDSMKFAKLPFSNAERVEQVFYRRKADPDARWWQLPPQVRGVGQKVYDVVVVNELVLGMVDVMGHRQEQALETLETPQEVER